MTATVTQKNMIDCQVCVPDDWTDLQIQAFANMEHPSGLDAGWYIRKEGDPALNGDPERQPCSKKPGHVHVMLDA